MNKNPQYNQQTEPKQCKPEGEERCIHKNLETTLSQQLGTSQRRSNVAATWKLAPSQQLGSENK